MKRDEAFERAYTAYRLVNTTATSKRLAREMYNAGWRAAVEEAAKVAETCLSHDGLTIARAIRERLG